MPRKAAPRKREPGRNGALHVGAMRKAVAFRHANRDYAGTLEEGLERLRAVLADLDRMRCDVQAEIEVQEKALRMARSTGNMD